jgi:hypothetical protein
MAPVHQPRGAQGPAVAAPHGYEVTIEHVPDPRCAFHLVTIRSEEEGPLRMWGVVAFSKDEVLAAAARRLEELIALRGDVAAEAHPGSGRPQVA